MTVYDLQWVRDKLTELHIELNDEIDIQLSGERSALIILETQHPQHGEAEFILKRAGYKVGSAYDWNYRWLHVTWDENDKPDVLGAMGFDVDGSIKIP